MKRVIDIEALLTWTYVDELPKRELSSAEANWDNIGEHGKRGGVSIETSAPQRYASVSPPHADAVIVENRVKGLPAALGGRGDRVSVDYAASRAALFGDVLMLSPPTLALPEFNLVTLVKTMAVMRRRPRWNVGALRPQRTLGKNGKPVIVGIDRHQNYQRGAHCPLTWSPSLYQVAEARAEYLLWHRALTELVGSLADSLTAHAPALPAAPAEPWIDAHEATGTIWGKPLFTPQVMAAVRAARRGRRSRLFDFTSGI